MGIYKQVRFFGWNEEDELENQMVKKLFDDIDSDGGGSLDKDETANLFKKLAITLSDTEYNQVSSARSGLPLDLFTVLLLEDGSLARKLSIYDFMARSDRARCLCRQVFAELDRAGDGEISYHEFKQWWFLKKNGKPYMDKCPSPFLDALCAVIRTEVRTSSPP